MNTKTMTAKQFFSSPWRILGFALLMTLTLIWLSPFFAALITSVRTNDDLMVNGFISLPEQINLSNFKTAWDRGGLSKYLPNSFIITLPALVATLFCHRFQPMRWPAFAFVATG